MKNQSNQSIIVQCLRPNCRFRFPAEIQNAPGHCPKCGSPTRISPYSNKPPDEKPVDIQQQTCPIDILLDNIRSAYNVGSILRSADACGISHVHCAGITPTPDQLKVQKTALGAQDMLPWTQHWNTQDCVQQAKQNGYQIISFEFTTASTSLFELAPSMLRFPVLLVFGNEVAGVDPEIIHSSDYTLHIPMYGKKSSINVATASGIAMYFIRYYSQITQ